MPAVDRNVLRLGVWELLYADDVPGTVAVTEAMALVRTCRPTSRRRSSTASSARSSALTPPTS